MIQFEPLISWTWAYIFAFLILGLLSVQIYWIQKSADSTLKKRIKTVLNTLFFVSLVAFIFQPKVGYRNSETGILVYSADVSREQIRYWKDSLNLKKDLRIALYRGEPGPVYLLGDGFSQLDLLKFSGQNVKCISDPKAQGLSFLNWKGILRQGEIQTIYGKLHSGDSIRMKIIQAGEVLAEMTLDKGDGEFKLEFPSLLIGRNEVDLHVNDSLLGRIRFFSKVPEPIRYSLKFDFPGPEVRFLGQHLVSSGQLVSEEITVSKSAVIQSNASQSDSVGFLIIDPAQLDRQETKKAIKTGVSVLIMNLNNVQQDFSLINKALETDFAVSKVSSDESRKVQDDLEAAPYEMEAKPAQVRHFENAFAVQRVGNSKVGVSLLGQTFPIKLAGDSLRYRRIWQEILGALLPDESGSVSFDAPVFQGLNEKLTLNQQGVDEDYGILGSDTVYSRPSLVNPFSETIEMVSPDSGWVSLGDSLEYYSYAKEEWASVFAAKLRAGFLRQNPNDPSVSSELKIKGLSDWVWYAVLVLLLALIWMEPKVLK